MQAWGEARGSSFLQGARPSAPNTPAPLLTSPAVPRALPTTSGATQSLQTVCWCFKKVGRNETLPEQLRKYKYLGRSFNTYVRYATYKGGFSLSSSLFFLQIVVMSVSLQLCSISVALIRTKYCSLYMHSKLKDRSLKFRDVQIRIQTLQICLTGGCRIKKVFLSWYRDACA